MSKYLIMTSEVYRVGSEKEAENAINEAKKDNRFELAKYTAVKKNRKEKKEIVDEWIQLTLVKKFCDEKEPDCTASVNHTIDHRPVPDPVSRVDDEEDEF